MARLILFALVTLVSFVTGCSYEPTEYTAERHGILPAPSADAATALADAGASIGDDMNPQDAIDAGTRTVDDRRSNYGNTVEVQSLAIEQYNTATRLVEINQVSVQAVTLTWTGALLTTAVNTISWDAHPVLKVTAYVGSVKQEYMFDATPGGEYTFVCSGLTVDVGWDTSAQQIVTTGLEQLWRSFVTAAGAAQTGKYRISAMVREGTGVRNSARYTQLLAQAQVLDAAFISVPAPSWATSFCAVQRPDFATTSTAVEQDRNYSVNDITSSKQVVAVYLPADLDKYQAAGVSLPVIGDSVTVSAPTVLSAIVWMQE